MLIICHMRYLSLNACESPEHLFTDNAKTHYVKQELLALEEQIGTVSTGLSEDKIETSMKQRKYEAMEMSMKLEPCCICQV